MVCMHVANYYIWCVEAEFMAVIKHRGSRSDAARVIAEIKWDNYLYCIISRYC